MSDLTLTESAAPRRAPEQLLALLWQRRWVALLAGAAVAAMVGLVIGMTMPRGPATAGQALLVMVAGLGVGLAAGLLSRSRWAMLPALLAYMLAVEIARLDAVGPTVDWPRLDNTFGILAFLLGRGFHGLVGLLPLVLGVDLGVRAARRLDGPVAPAHGRAWRIAGWVLTATLAFLLLALAIAIALPASTPPILDAEGNPIPGSIAELTSVEIGGHEQALLLRGYDVEKPVLLYLSGGPGQSSLPWPRVLFDDLSREFVVVGWDQRGTGKSYAALDPDDTLTLDANVADAVAVTDYLRERFAEEKIYLLGESWGSTLAVLAAQQRPELYHAVIGSGQMVSQYETDRRLYYDVLDLAERTGDTALKAQMLAFGEPPYRNLFAYLVVMGYYEQLYQPYTPPAAFLEKGAAAGLGPWNVLGSEYNFVEKVNVFRGFLDTAAVVYPQLQEIDFRQDVPRLETALVVLDGAAELSARRDLALEWFEQVDAPLKRLITYENAAHAPAFEHFEDFTRLMSDVVLPESYR